MNNIYANIKRKASLLQFKVSSLLEHLKNSFSNSDEKMTELASTAKRLSWELPIFFSYEFPCTGEINSSSDFGYNTFSCISGLNETFFLLLKYDIENKTKELLKNLITFCNKIKSSIVGLIFSKEDAVIPEEPFETKQSKYSQDYYCDLYDSELCLLQ